MSREYGSQRFDAARFDIVTFSEDKVEMKPYSELTRRGKLRRLRGLAIEALFDYDLSVQEISYLTAETNTLFKLRTKDREKYVIRIYSDEETTLRENQAEMFWLQALIRDTDLKVIEPVARKDGEYITILSMPGVPGEKHCAVFKWVPGRALENDLSVENYCKLGQTQAMLHNHSETLNPLPAQIQPKRWDKVFYYPDEPVVYDSAEYSHLFSPEQVAIMDETIACAMEEFERLFANQSGQMLIHGDLHFWNVHIHQGELHVIDFEDVMLGYPVQDIAITLYYGQDQDSYPKWRAGFEQGYTSLRAWPVESERQLETLMAARRANFINYVARVDDSPQEFIETRCEGLKKYLEKYG